MHACSCSCALLLLLLLLLPRVPPPPPPPPLPTTTSKTTPTTTWKMERYMSSSVSGGGRSSGCDAGWMMPAGVLGLGLGLGMAELGGVCMRACAHARRVWRMPTAMWTRARCCGVRACACACARACGARIYGTVHVEVEVVELLPVRVGLRGVDRHACAGVRPRVGVRVRVAVDHIWRDHRT